MTDTLTPRTVTWLTSLANAALVVLLGISGALLMLDLLPLGAAGANASGGPTWVPKQNAQQATPASQGQALGEQIAQANLFGQASAQKAAKPVAPRPSNAPKTKLNLTLSGVLAFQPQERSLAIIRVGGGPEQVFAIGDPVGSRAVLKEVYADKAIIEHNNTLETLPLPRDNRADQGLSLQAARPSAPTPVQSAPAISNLPTTPGKLRERLVREPQLMGQLMRVAPYQQNGTTIGYQLTPKQGADILQNYGIYPGDVVTSLNGVSLTSQRRGLNAMRRLVNAKNLEMTVLRNGVEVPVSISFE